MSRVSSWALCQFLLININICSKGCLCAVPGAFPMPLKLANTDQKLPPLLLVSLLLFRKMTVIQLFDRFVIQSKYAVDACHSSSTKGSRLPRKQPSRGAGSISGCPFQGCREHYRVVGCKFIKSIFTLIYSMLFKLHAV